MVQSLLTFAIAILFLYGLYHSRKAGVSVAEHYKPYFTWKSSFRNYTKTEELMQNYAKQISVRELISRPFPKDQTQVPKLLHQSWNTAKLPSKFQHWSMTCRLANPDWEWVLWTDEDNEELIQRHGRWLIDTYYGLQANIYRADAVRNIYMHVFGGYGCITHEMTEFSLLTGFQSLRRSRFRMSPPVLRSFRDLQYHLSLSHQPHKSPA